MTYTILPAVVLSLPHPYKVGYVAKEQLAKSHPVSVMAGEFEPR